MLLLGIVGAFLAALSQAVEAQRSFECQTVWSQPSPDNDVMECVMDQDRLKSQMRYFALGIVAAASLGLILLASPFVVCALCNCCYFKGKTRLYEGDEAANYEYKSPQLILNENQLTRTKTLLFSIHGIIALTVVLFLLVLGSVMIRNGVADILLAIKTGPLQYLFNVKSAIQELLIDNTKNSVSSHVNLTAFDDLRFKISAGVDNARDTYMKYANMVVAIALFMGIAGIIFGVATLLGALIHCPRPIPLVMGWMYYVLTVIYLLLSLAMGIVAPLLSALCGEVVLQYDREPGVMQWYVLPLAEDNIHFETVRTQIDDAIKSALVAFCDAVLDYCEGTKRTPYYTCGGITSSDECVSIDFVFNQVIPNLLLLPVFQPFCPAPSDVADSTWSCTVTNCSSMCTLQPLREAAKFLIDKSSYIANVSTALSYMLPMVNTDYIIDIMTAIVESPPTVRSAAYSHPDEAHCSQIRGASWMMAAGFFIGSCTFFALLVVLVCVRNSWMESKLVEKELKTRVKSPFSGESGQK